MLCSHFVVIIDAVQSLDKRAYVQVNFISTGDFYEDFHLQTGDIRYLTTGDIAGLQNASFL